MSWLAGYVIASIAVAFLVVKVFDYILSGLFGSISHAIRASLFVGVGTAVTTGAGLRGWKKWTKKLRNRIGRKKGSHE